MATILQLKVAKRRLFEKVSLERCIFVTGILCMHSCTCVLCSSVIDFNPFYKLFLFFLISVFSLVPYLVWNKPHHHVHLLRDSSTYTCKICVCLVFDSQINRLFSCDVITFKNLKQKICQSFYPHQL